MKIIVTKNSICIRPTIRVEWLKTSDKRLIIDVCFEWLCFCITTTNFDKWFEL
jgi:hypothetical protein